MKVDRRAFQRGSWLPRVWQLALCLALLPALSLWGQREDPFKEAYSYINNNRLGERLSVSFPNGENDSVKSTEMTLLEESFFDGSTGRFEKRVVAVLTGMGLGNTGLKLVADDARQLEDFRNCLQRFLSTEREFLANEERIREQTEDWMGESWNALNTGREIGSVYFYPSRKALSAEFMWDFELERVWLSIGSRIMVQREVVPYLLRLVENLPAHRDRFYEFREALQSKNQEIDALLGLDAAS